LLSSAVESSSSSPSCCPPATRLALHKRLHDHSENAALGPATTRRGTLWVMWVLWVLPRPPTEGYCGYNVGTVGTFTRVVFTKTHQSDTSHTTATDHDYTELPSVTLHSGLCGRPRLMSREYGRRPRFRSQFSYMSCFLCGRVQPLDVAFHQVVAAVVARIANSPPRAS
jgi:hypothetical protein